MNVSPVKDNTQRRRQKKLKAIEYLGGVCIDCGCTYDPCVYEFHHINPEEKDMDFSKMRGLRWETIKEELDKCVLLCSNCHKVRHYGEE